MRLQVGTVVKCYRKKFVVDIKRIQRETASTERSQRVECIQFSSTLDFNTLPVDCQNFIPLTVAMLCSVCCGTKTMQASFSKSAFSAFLFAYKEAKTANLLSQSLAKRLILRKPLKSKQSLDFLVTIFSFHSIFSQGKNVDTDLRVTDFGVTLLFVTLGITVFTSQGKRSH